MGQFSFSASEQMRATKDAHVWLANEIRGGWTDQMLRTFARRFASTGCTYGAQFADEIDQFIRCRQKAVRQQLGLDKVSA